MRSYLLIIKRAIVFIGNAMAEPNTNIKKPKESPVMKTDVLNKQIK